MTKLQRDTGPQHPLWQLTLMRWRIFVREPSALFWTYGFPVVLALFLGVAFRNRPPEPVEVAVEAIPGNEAWREVLSTNSKSTCALAQPTVCPRGVAQWQSIRGHWASNDRERPSEQSGATPISI